MILSVMKEGVELIHSHYFSFLRSRMEIGLLETPCKFYNYLWADRDTSFWEVKTKCFSLAPDSRIKITSGFYPGGAYLLLSSDSSPKQGSDCGLLQVSQRLFQRLQCSLTSYAARAQVGSAITFKNKVLVIRSPFSFKWRKQNMHTRPCWQHYSLVCLTTPRIHSSAPGNHLRSKASGDLGPWFGTLISAFAARALSPLAASFYEVNVRLLTVMVTTKTAPHLVCLHVGVYRQVRT